MPRDITQVEHHATPTHTDSRHTPHKLPMLARPGLLSVIWAVLMVYGSLLPFDLYPARFFAEHGGFWPGLAVWLSGPGWVQATGETTPLGFSLSAVDLIVNLVLYIPLGVLLRITLRRRGLGNTAQVLLAGGALAALGWLMESTQAWSPTRVASLADFVANVGMGLCAVLVAPWLWGGMIRLIFWGYCRCAWPIHLLRVRMRFVRRSPGVMLALVLLTAALLTGWYATQAARAFASPASAQASGEVALPFERHFDSSYDTAALLLGRSLLVYAAVGCLLSLSMLRSQARPTLRRVVLGVLLVALLVELYRSSVGVSYRADITEPIIAIAAALLMAITTYLFAHAIRRANRRHTQAEFPGPDRRRVRYSYRH
ncbi:MAG: hypothetical protein ACIAXF_17110 [Phycisphaerales bacterium JB063]